MFLQMFNWFGVPRWTRNENNIKTLKIIQITIIQFIHDVVFDHLIYKKKYISKKYKLNPKNIENPLPAHIFVLWRYICMYCVVYYVIYDFQHFEFLCWYNDIDLKKKTRKIQALNTVSQCVYGNNITENKIKPEKNVRF